MIGPEKVKAEKVKDKYIQDLRQWKNDFVEQEKARFEEMNISTWWLKHDELKSETIRVSNDLNKLHNQLLNNPVNQLIDVQFNFEIRNNVVQAWTIYKGEKWAWNNSRREVLTAYSKSLFPNGPYTKVDPERMKLSQDLARIAYNQHIEFLKEKVV